MPEVVVCRRDGQALRPDPIYNPIGFSCSSKQRQDRDWKLKPVMTTADGRRKGNAVCRPIVCLEHDQDIDMVTVGTMSPREAAEVTRSDGCNERRYPIGRDYRPKIAHRLSQNAGGAIAAPPRCVDPLIQAADGRCWSNTKSEYCRFHSSKRRCACLHLHLEGELCADACG